MSPSPSGSPTKAQGFGQRGSLTYAGEAVVRFTSPAVVWRIADQRVYRSADAGQSWQAVLTTNSDATAIEGSSWFFDDSRAVVVGGDYQLGFRFYRTEDAGQSWQDAVVPSGTLSRGQGDHLLLSSFASPSNGWILVEEGASSPGSKTLILSRTTDGGEHWSVVSRSDHDSLPDHLPLNAAIDHMTFADASTGWVTGGMVTGGAPAGPAVYITIDGGRTWKPQDLPPAPGLDFTRAEPTSGPLWPATGDGVLLPVRVNQPLPPGSPPRSFDARVVMYRSGDGGHTWSSPLVLPETPPTDVAICGGVLDASHWWLAVWRDIWVSSDAGRTWVHRRPNLVEGGRFGGMSFGDPRHAYAILVTGPATAALERFSYLESADGGATWHPAAGVPGS